MDKYSKSPTVVTQSEGTSFAQKGKKRGATRRSLMIRTTSRWNMIKISIKIGSVSIVVRRDIPSQLAQ